MGVRVTGTTEPEISSYRQNPVRTQRDIIHNADQPVGRARRVILGLIPVALGLALGVWLWAGSQGYVPPLWGGGGCTDEGYPSPMPSFDELVEDYGKSPYCARDARDEAWF